MNGIYLKLLLNEIANKICGRYIDEIRINKRLLQIVIGKQSLFVSLYPEIPAMFFAQRMTTGFTKHTNFSRLVISNRIKSIAQDGLMPVLRIDLEKRSVEIIISLYRAAPNFIIKTKTSEQKLYKRVIKKEAKRSVLTVSQTEHEHIYKERSEDYGVFLLREFEGLDKELSKELTPKRIAYLNMILQKGGAKPRIVSIDPLQISLYSTKFLNKYDSLNELFKEGVSQFVARKDRKHNAALRKARAKKIKRQLIRLHEGMLQDEEIEAYRIKGELILTNLVQIKKGSKHLVAKDPYNNKELTIALDPAVNPQDNASHYFSEYKKLKRGKPKIKNKIDRLKEELAKLKDASYELPVLQKLPRKKLKKTEPFRIFNLASGSVVYTGKNARSNNELTFAFARPNDYFFHIRNYEGAHVILRAKIPRGQRPNKRDLLAAAGIAAHFSKAKKQKNVPVSYTQRKYLKKNKKGKPGSVILMREEVVFVDPKLPE